MDNGHGPVAHSAWVPPYSTQSLTSKLETMIVPLLINLRALIKTFHITINQGCILVMYVHHQGTMTHFTIVCRTSNIYFASCLSMHACMHACHFCWKPQLTSPISKQCYPHKIFLISPFCKSSSYKSYYGISSVSNSAKSSTVVWGPSLW